MIALDMNLQFDISLIVILKKKIKTKLHPKKKYTNHATLSPCVIYRQIICELQSSGRIPGCFRIIRYFPGPYNAFIQFNS